MRAALSFSCLLLLLALALNLSGGSYDSWILARDNEDILASGTSIRLFSCGNGLPPAYFEIRPREEGIAIDSQHFSRPYSEDGLRLVAIDPEGEIDFTNFAFRTSDADAEAFDRFVRTAPLDTVMVAGLLRTIAPEGSGSQARRAKLQQAFALLGAEAPPLDNPRVSWGFIAIRRTSGWRRIIEKRSATKGIALEWSLPEDRSRLELEPLRDLRLDESLDLDLIGVLSAAECHGPAAYVVEYLVRSTPQRSIEAPPPLEGSGDGLALVPNKIVWPFVELPEGALLRTNLGIRQHDHMPRSCVRFEVWVAGERVAHRVVTPLPMGWHPWEVALTDSPALEHGGWTSLELRIVPLYPQPADQMPEPVAWGSPRIVTAAAVEVQEPSVMNRFDRNRDRFVSKDELRQSLLLFDRNEDGVVEAREVPENLHTDLAGIDANRDLRASSEEITRWVDVVWSTGRLP